MSLGYPFNEIFGNRESAEAEIITRMQDIGLASPRIKIGTQGKASATPCLRVDAQLPFAWSELIGFIYDRLNLYRNQKRQHRQWETTGQRLFRLMDDCRSSGGKEEFIRCVQADW